jgi:hypothetical protein
MIWKVKGKNICKRWFEDTHAHHLTVNRFAKKYNVVSGGGDLIQSFFGLSFISTC